MNQTIRIITFVLITVLLCFCSAPEDHWTLESSAGTVSVKITLGHPDPKDRADHSLYYTVFLEGEEAMPPAPMGILLECAGGDFTGDLQFVEHREMEIREEYPMPVGKRSAVTNHTMEKTLVFRNTDDKEMHLVLRACEEGIAFRYHLPGEGDVNISSERSAFRVPAGSRAWLQPYMPHYERYYIEKTLAEETGPALLTAMEQYYADLDADKEYISDIAFPVLTKTPAGHWLLLTEAAVYGNYCGSRLYNDTVDATLLRIRLDSGVRSALPLSIPWRVVFAARSLKTIVESDLVLNLNPLSEFDDFSWIKPGISTFPWLSDHDVNGKPERLKEFVDLAAGMGWKWIEFDNALAFGDFGGNTPFGKWLDLEWIPGFIKYANDRGIRVSGWDTWKNLNTPEKRNTILGYYTRHGFSGIKVDFLDSDSQERFRFRDTIIQECLERKLMISFHGATLPRGQQRRWPHIMTWESVLGEESYTYPRGMPTAEHNTILCFTRNVAGSMDYTPSSFTQLGKPGFERTTTDAHQMALAVMFESGWQNIGASPEGLAQTMAREFLMDLPAAWDDIRFIEGYPGKYCVLARRKEGTWYLAGINAGFPRTVSILPDFLAPGIYYTSLFRDDSRGKVVSEKIIVESTRPLEIHMPANGGFGVRIPGQPVRTSPHVD